MYCSQCGSLLPNDAKFCSKCGVAVMRGAMPPKQPPAPTFVPSNAPVAAAPAAASGAVGALQPVAGFAIAAGICAIINCLLRAVSYGQMLFRYVDAGLDMDQILSAVASTLLGSLLPLLLVLGLAICLFVQQRKAVGVIAIIYALVCAVSWVSSLTNVSFLVERGMFQNVFSLAVSPLFTIVELALVAFMALSALNKERRVVRFVPFALALLFFICNLVVNVATLGFGVLPQILVSSFPSSIAWILLMLFAGLWLCPTAQTAQTAPTVQQYVPAAQAAQGMGTVQVGMTSEELLTQYNRLQAGEITQEEFQQYHDRFVAG